jgi:hypothetical protein
MFRPFEAILRQPLVDLKRHPASARMSVRILLVHTATARCRLRMSLTPLSYCGVHAVFPLCVALPSRACTPRRRAVVTCNKYIDIRGDTVRRL